jgi:hypothetical protein
LPCVVRARRSSAIFRHSAIVLASLFVLTGATLPETGPIPLKRPDEAASTQRDETPEKNNGKEKPEAKPDAESGRQPQDEKPEDKQPDGEEAGDGKAKNQQPDDDQQEKKKPEPSQIVKEDPEALKACMAALNAAGATFKEAPRVEDGSQCGIDAPIELSAVAPGVTVEPAARIRCETALALSRWTTASVVPALEAALPGEKLVSLQQASGYVCRNRNGATNGKISEHALGSAIDIASFTFESGKSLAIAPREKDSSLEGAFQQAVVATACLYFTTVLDPGSDAAHETHLHLDVKARRNGYRYCW